MKLKREVLLIFILIFSLVCSPVFAASNQNNVVNTTSKFNGEAKIGTNTVYEGVLIAQTQRKGFWQRLGFKTRKSKPKLKRQGFLKKINRQQSKPKVQQKQKRQGFWSRFKLQPRNQKRGF
jgi:hypothetical protein